MTGRYVKFIVEATTDAIDTSTFKMQWLVSTKHADRQIYANCLISCVRVWHFVASFHVFGQRSFRVNTHVNHCSCSALTRVGIYSRCKK